MPEDGKTLSFKNFPNICRAPFVIYADFQAMVQANEEFDPQGGQKTFKYQGHTASSVGFKIKSYFTQLDEPYHYFNGAKCVLNFNKYMVQFEKRAWAHYLDDKRLLMSTPDEQDFQ